MLTRKNLLACVFTGAGLMTTIAAAHAGGMAGMRSVNVGNISNKLGALNCKNFGSAQKLNVYSNNSITNNVNRATNINVNKKLTVYSPVNVTTNIDRSTNINAETNIDNSKTIDNSTNITVNKSINVRTTNIFNGMGQGSDHSQGGTWGGHTGNMGGGCGTMCGGGSNNGGGSNQNNNGNQNSNGNENNIDN